MEHSGRSPFADHSNIGIDRLGVGRHSWNDRSKVIFDGGTATPFVVVATIFNGVFLLGWRVFARSRARRPDRGVPLG